jgi:ribonuclease Z
MGAPRPGRKVVYTGDTRPKHGEWMDWARDCDLLIHDSTFDDSEQERACEVYHSTAGGAGRIASEISAHRLALVHISSRYVKMISHIEDAEKYYQGNIFAPDDLTMTELPFRDE